MRYETIIWDLDGTLLDTVEDLADSVNAALSAFGLEQRPVEFIRATIGHGISDLVSRSMPEGSDKALFDQVFAFFKTHYAGNCCNKTHPYDGIPEIVSYLSAQGIKMAIVSNKVDSAAKALGQLFFSDTIPVVFGELPQFRKKPAPEIVYEAMRLIGAGDGKSAYIGDSEVDITTAVNAGMDSVCVSWGFRGRKLLEDGGAPVIVDTPAELLEYLKG